MSALLNLEVANTVSQTVAASNPMNLGYIVRKYSKGCCEQTFSYLPYTTGISINQSGYYQVTVNMTVSSSSTGSADVSLYVDGTKLDLTDMSETISTATTEYRSISFGTILRVYPNKPITISVVNSGLIPLTINPLTTQIVKIC